MCSLFESKKAFWVPQSALYPSYQKMHVDQNKNAANGKSTSHNGSFDANYSKQIISVVGYAIHLNFLTNPFLMKQKMSIQGVFFFLSKFKEISGHWQRPLPCFLVAIDFQRPTFLPSVAPSLPEMRRCQMRLAFLPKSLPASRLRVAAPGATADWSAS